MKRYHIFKDGKIIGSAATEKAAMEFIRTYQQQETHPFLRAEFSYIYGEEKFVPYQETKHNKKLKNESEDKKMNSFSMDERFARRMKDNYPPGTRIVLENMTDPYAPVEPGTRGTVDYVDDAGTLHMKWDNGRTLGVVPGEDDFRKLTEAELAEEKRNILPSINGELVPLTSDEDASFMGYTTEDKWNGWECPLFPKESADQIMAYVNGEGSQMTYDAEKDIYTVNYPYGDEMESFKGEDYLINGNIEHLYPIGSHTWIWDRAVSEENTPTMGM